MSRSRDLEATAMATTPISNAPTPQRRGPAAILAAPEEFGCLPAVVRNGAELRRLGCDRRRVRDHDDRDMPRVVVGPQCLDQSEVAETRRSEVGKDDLRRGLFGSTYGVGLVQSHEHRVALTLQARLML